MWGGSWVVKVSLGKLTVFLVVFLLPEIKSWAGASRTYGYPDPRGQIDHITIQLKIKHSVPLSVCICVCSSHEFIKKTHIFPRAIPHLKQVSFPSEKKKSLPVFLHSVIGLWFMSAPRKRRRHDKWTRSHPRGRRRKGINCRTGGCKNFRRRGIRTGSSDEMKRRRRRRGGDKEGGK